MKERERGSGRSDRVQKVVSLNPGTTYWMDNLSHLFVVKIVMGV